MFRFFVYSFIIWAAIITLSFSCRAESLQDNSVVLLASPQVLLHKAFHSGTGFEVVAPSGAQYTVTNAHVCDEAYQGLLIADLDIYEGVFIHILYVDTAHDLCFLEPVKTRAPLRVSQENDIGGALTAIGHPRGGPLTTTHGIALERNKIAAGEEIPVPAICGGNARRIVFSPDEKHALCLTDVDAFHSTIHIQPGSSGSPVLNGVNEVVGVIFSEDRDSTGFFIPVQYLRNDLSKF